MEAWRLMGWTAGLLLIWSVLINLLGYEIGPIAIFVATIFGMLGFYASAKLAERIAPEEEAE